MKHIETNDSRPSGSEDYRLGAPEPSELLEAAIQDGTAVIGVIGLGYVGLPLLRQFVGAGYRTLGFDVDENKVDRLRSGNSYIEHVPADEIAEWLECEQFEATSDMGRLPEADVILICVPAPLTPSRDPDMSYLRRTARFVATTLRPGQLIILQSTTFPTTTREIMLPLLNISGLQAGQDFFIAYTPEREDYGNPAFAAVRIPRLIAGWDPLSRELAQLLYEQTSREIIPVSSLEVAEACRILENTYRAVNIALVNELKTLFDRMGIDIWEVIEMASTKPFGFQAFYPGPGVGGHTAPIDPFYLTWLARNHGLTTRFIELTGEVNASMPGYVVSRLSEFLNESGKPIKGSRIGILGVAYKKDLDDPRESPAFAILELLQARGAEVSFSDPHIARLPQMRHHASLPELDSQPLTAEYLARQDCVLVVTDHSAFDYEFIVENSMLVVDTRNSTRNVRYGREKIRRA
jgi:UDP-N-acetyl-D-glucosamine dehydrogenase